MGIFKEEIIFLEELARRQHFIWNDSADVGIEVSEMDVGRMREVIKTLLELPGSCVTWRVNKPALQRQYQLIVMWSKHDTIGGKDLYDATKANILYFKGRGKEFFSIEIGHALTSKNGIVQ